MWERFPPRMRRMITTAIEEAGRGGCEDVAPEHLLRAMLADPECAAVFMFERAGINAGRLIESLNSESPQAPAPPLPYAARLSPASLQLLEVATREADRVGDRHVGTEHVALALTQVNGTPAPAPAAAALAALGFTHDRADAALKQWHREGMPRVRSGTWRFLQPIVRLWHVFVGRSIGHPKFVTDPYSMYRKLREREPIRRDPIAPVWVITTYADTFNLLRDPRFRKDPFGQQRLPREMREQLGASALSAARASLEMTSMLFLDPPQHTRVRSIFTKAFTPRRLESLRPRIAVITERLLAAVQPIGRMDLMADFAAPLPVTVIAELLGFPPEDYRQIKKWSDEMAEALGLAPTQEQAARAYRAREEIRVYFDLLVERLRKQPGENLLSALLELEAQGEGLVGDELFANSILLLAAGHETTTNLIGNGMLALLRHPDQLRDLREHPELIGSAIEELLRYDPPVQWTSRVAGEDFEFAGKQLKRGDILLASVGAANRDPAAFKDPDRLDIRRSDNKHLAFGSGIHFCLGAALARMEGEIAIATLLRHMPNLKLARQKIRWRKGITFRGVESLHLEF